MVAKSTYTPTNAVSIVRQIGEAVEAEVNAYAVEHGCDELFRVCYLVPGEIVWDDCHCGMLAQTITDVVPSNTPPSPATDTRQTACGPGIAVIRVTLVVVRCMPVTDDNGNPPSCDEMLSVATCVESDRAAMRKASACKLREMREAYTVLEFGVNGAATIGPQGGCVGSQLTYWFAIHDDTCCV